VSGTDTEVIEEFSEARDRLIGIAYGIIGDLGEAEDVVQEAWLRLFRSNADIEDVTGWLVVTTSRLALDVVRSARRRRESYVGPWLPEPLVTRAEPGADPAERTTLADTISMAMLVVLESLSPAERTAFVLHEVFGLALTEVARVVGRTPAAVRQLAARARKHVQQRSPRFDADPVRQRVVADAFASACEGADLAGLLTLLDPDVVLRSDGGGVVRSARRPLFGADKVARFLVGINRRAPFRLRPVRVNGWDGFLTYREGGLYSAIALTVGNGRITAMDIVTQPDKLARTRELMRNEENQWKLA
jgi:RNA polymerase sigma-70 factor (ECF subfamily)